MILVHGQENFDFLNRLQYFGIPFSQETGSKTGYTEKKDKSELTF